MNESTHFDNGVDILLTENAEELPSPAVSRKKILDCSEFHDLIRKCSYKSIFYTMVLILLFIIAISSIISKNNSTVKTSPHIIVLKNITIKSMTESSHPSFITHESTTQVSSNHSILQNNNTRESPHHYKIFISDMNQIRTYDLKTKRSSLYYEITENFVTFDVMKSSIFYTVKSSNLIQSFNTSYSNITYTKKLQPQAIAIDSLTKKFYILDKSAGTVNVMDFEGKYFGVMFSHFEELHDIVLDIEEGYIFILQYMKKILRANLDGSNLQEIVNNKIVAMEINRQEKRIFWAEATSKIKSANYDGKKLTILAIPKESSIKSLAIHENQIFWLSSFENIDSINASLWTCKYDQDTCVNHEKLPMLYHNPTSIKAFIDSDSIETQLANPCRINNGNCSDFCFQFSNKRKTCGCRTSYKLKLDSQTCELDKRDFILYTSSKYLRGVALNSTKNDAFRDIIVPNSLGGGVKYFDYDVEHDNLYFYKNNAINIMNIKNDSETNIIVETSTTGIAFDWASKNFYYIDSDNNLWIISNKSNVFIKKKISSSIFKFIIDVNRGNIFFTSQINHVNSIKVDFMNLNGSNSKNYFSYDFNDHKFNSYDYNYGYRRNYDKSMIVSQLVLDEDDHVTCAFANNTLYFENSSLSKKITLPLLSVKSICFKNKNIYMAQEEGIWKMNKESGETATQIISNFKEENILEIKVFGSERYFKNLQNECVENNGGCMSFCFSKPQKTCGCIDNYQLQDELNCSA